MIILLQLLLININNTYIIIIQLYTNDNDNNNIYIYLIYKEQYYINLSILKNCISCHIAINDGFCSISTNLDDGTSSTDWP